MRGRWPSLSNLASEYPDVRVIGLDLSSDMLRHYAPKSVAYLGIERDGLVRVHASALDLPTADGSLDGVVGVINKLPIRVAFLPN